MNTTTEEVQVACSVLAQHAALVGQNANALMTLKGLATRYQREAARSSAVSPPPPAAPEPEPPLDAEDIYSRRRAAIAAAQQRRTA
jgi:hypothetical protein